MGTHIGATLEGHFAITRYRVYRQQLMQRSLGCQKPGSYLLLRRSFDRSCLMS